MTSRPTTRYQHGKWASNPSLRPTAAPPHATAATAHGSSSGLWQYGLHCPYDYMCVGMSLVYLVLFVRCLLLAREHHGSWSNRQAHGLAWYLFCTMVLCACRVACFAMVPFMAQDCDGSSYRVWSWEMDGLVFGPAPWNHWRSYTIHGPNAQGLSLALALLSLLALQLFFTSYTYFAHSLSKVLEMLISDLGAAATAESRFLVLLMSFSICIWVSGTALSLCLFSSPGGPLQLYADGMAQSGMALAAVVTSGAFATLFVRAWLWFARRQDEHREPVGRAAQLTRLLRLRRVRGVCCVCTAVFTVRAVALFFRAPLWSLLFAVGGGGWGPLLEVAFLGLLDAAPTAYMLQAFRSSSLAEAAATGSGAHSPHTPTGHHSSHHHHHHDGPKTPLNEFDVLKATLTSNLAVVSSPARTGFTSRYYATPDKASSVQSLQDAEERSRLLHTPGSEAGGPYGHGGGAGLDALELERGMELYRL